MSETRSKSSSDSGCGCLTIVGMILAFLVSYQMWHSIGWALLAGLLGWLYIAYYIVIYVLN